MVSDRHCCFVFPIYSTDNAAYTIQHVHNNIIASKIASKSDS